MPKPSPKASVAGNSITISQPTRVPIKSPKASGPQQSLFSNNSAVLKKHPSTTKNTHSPRVEQRPTTATKPQMREVEISPRREASTLTQASTTRS